MNKIKSILYIILISIILWSAITTTIFSFINPSKTETERFLHIPKSFILDFQENEQGEIK